VLKNLTQFCVNRLTADAVSQLSAELFFNEVNRISILGEEDAVVVCQ